MTKKRPLGLSGSFRKQAKKQLSYTEALLFSGVALSPVTTSKKLDSQVDGYFKLKRVTFLVAD